MTATCAIIPASGLGERLNSSTDKAFTLVAGRPLLAHTLAVFQSSPDIDSIIVVIREGLLSEAHKLVKDNNFSKVSAIVPGGHTRQDSVRNGLAALTSEYDIIVIHDAARPLISHSVIREGIEAAQVEGAAITAVPVIDTIKTSEDGKYVKATLDRRTLYCIQTPQTFKRDIIQNAYEKAYEDSFIGTDDASLVERLGQPVAIVEGTYNNIKLTVPIDKMLVEAIMSTEMQAAKTSMMTQATLTYAIGHGYDVHQFAEDRKLYLGGIEFPGEVGLLGHSDADVVLHAVTDALLGGAGGGDIGKAFPDTDPRYKDIRSTILLSHARKIISESGWKVSNVDVTLIAEKPRISDRVPEMREKISEILQIPANSVNIKATTAEGLGFVGEKLGIECHAVALLFR